MRNVYLYTCIKIVLLACTFKDSNEIITDRGCIDLRRSEIAKVVQESLAIELEEAEREGVLGFMARIMIQSTMPHSKPTTNEFERANGNFSLTMIAPSKIGLPYGTIPRLLMTWITSEAVKTKDKELLLGDSLSIFMGKLGLIPTGGRWGSITRLKDQSKRLFSTSISAIYNDGKKFLLQDVRPIKKVVLWWEPSLPNQPTLWNSTLVLTDDFFHEVTSRPVPINMDALNLLKRSSMKIDIYCWLTYRMSYLRRPTEIPWEALQNQFGAGYPCTPQGVRDFKKNFKTNLQEVLRVYTEASVAEGKHGLYLKASPTHINQL